MLYRNLSSCPQSLKKWSQDLSPDYLTTLIMKTCFVADTLRTSHVIEIRFKCLWACFSYRKSGGRPNLWLLFLINFRGVNLASGFNSLTFGLSDLGSEASHKQCFGDQKKEKIHVRLLPPSSGQDSIDFFLYSALTAGLLTQKGRAGDWSPRRQNWLSKDCPSVVPLYFPPAEGEAGPPGQGQPGFWLSALALFP